MLTIDKVKQILRTLNVCFDDPCDPTYMSTNCGGAGSSDYVSNVVLNGTDLNFSNVGSAFGGVVDLSSLSTPSVDNSLSEVDQNVTDTLRRVTGINTNDYLQTDFNEMYFLRGNYDLLDISTFSGLYIGENTTRLNKVNDTNNAEKSVVAATGTSAFMESYDDIENSLARLILNNVGTAQLSSKTSAGDLSQLVLTGTEFKLFSDNYTFFDTKLPTTDNTVPNLIGFDVNGNWRTLDKSSLIVPPVNIYNTDDALTGDRVADAAGNTMHWVNSSEFVVTDDTSFDPANIDDQKNTTKLGGFADLIYKYSPVASVYSSLSPIRYQLDIQGQDPTSYGNKVSFLMSNIGSFTLGGTNGPTTSNKNQVSVIGNPVNPNSESSLNIEVYDTSNPPLDFGGVFQFTHGEFQLGRKILTGTNGLPFINKGWTIKTLNAREQGNSTAGRYSLTWDLDGNEMIWEDSPSTAPSYATTAAAAGDAGLLSGKMFKVPNGDGTSSIHVKD